MITAKLKNGVMMLVVVFLLISFHSKAQKIRFAKNEKGIYINDIIYTAGSDNKNVFVWMYKYSQNLLQLNIYDSTMNLVIERSLKLVNCSILQGIDFFQKNNVYDVLLHYSTKNKVRTEIFSYDKSSDEIRSLQLLSQSDISAGLLIKYSNNGNYTGIIQAYATTEDTTLIQYSLFNSHKQLEKNIVVPLPYKHALIDFESSMIDDSGNLFFIAANSQRDSMVKQDITVYEVNPKKDSLLLNNITRSGKFQNLQILQNNTTGHLNLSGIWIDLDAKKLTHLAPAYLFLIDLNDDLSQKGEMTLFATDKLIDSIYSSAYQLRSQHLALSKDTGYVFYLSGLTGSTRNSFETIDYSMGGSRGSRGNYDYYSAVSSNYNTSPTNILEAGNFFRQPAVGAGTPVTGTSIYYNPLPTGYASGIPAPGNVRSFLGGSSRPYQLLPAGNNFFMRMSVSKNTITSIVHFKDSTLGTSSAESEFVANSGKGIHYIYSRELKNHKQLLFDVVFDAGGEIRSYPLIENSNYRLLLKSGVQVSSNNILFPYLYKGTRISFAKLDLN